MVHGPDPRSRSRRTPALLRTAVTSALIAVMTGIIYGVYPARHATMLDAVEALRNE